MNRTARLNALPDYTEERDFRFYNVPLPAQRYKTITLKGRLEFRKDYKAILHAASQTPGIVAMNFKDFEIEATWLSKGFSNDGKEIDYLPDAKKHIRKFAKLIREAPSLPCFSGLGLETHVFLQSLKPITEYDGERNGYWACR